MRGALRLPGLPLEAGFQTATLFVLDGLANLTDFAFHFWMARALIPAEFAALQTLNSIILVYVTANGVFQPAVARFVAEARANSRLQSIPSMFQAFMRAALWLGLGLALLVLIGAGVISHWLNLPVWSVQIIAILILISTLRPVPLGVLQGQERFISFGLARWLTALGRLLAGVILVGSGLSLQGAVMAFPIGWLAGVLAAVLALGRPIWKAGELPAGLLTRGLQLSSYALAAYLAFMSLASLDLIWVNRALAGDEAGAYAGLVLLRRVLALLPAVAVTVMFPRIAAALAEKRLPDRLLAGTAGVLLASGGALALIYFLQAERLIQSIFGSAYAAAAPLLGWMAVGMLGSSLSSIWLNYYLAEKPLNFVLLLIAAVVLEAILLTARTPSMQNATLAFGLTSWALALAGATLYLWKSRPALLRALHA